MPPLEKLEKNSPFLKAINSSGEGCCEEAVNSLVSDLWNTLGGLQAVTWAFPQEAAAERVWGWPASIICGFTLSVNGRKHKKHTTGLPKSFQENVPLSHFNFSETLPRKYKNYNQLLANELLFSSYTFSRQGSQRKGGKTEASDSLWGALMTPHIQKPAHTDTHMHARTLSQTDSVNCSWVTNSCHCQLSMNKSTVTHIIKV